MKLCLALLLCVPLSFTACGNGRSSELVTVVAEPSGAHCANGGEAIETGLDTNGNGVLDASEITSTSYVCNGSNGDAGVDGFTTLVETSTFAVGNGTSAENAACPNGGESIEAGLDTNGDGVLERSEVRATSYLCLPPNPTTIEGNFEVNNNLDAAKLIGVTEITGDLTINAPISSINLDSLQTVGGKFNAGTFAGSTLNLPSLTSVASLVTAPNSTLAAVNAPSLANAPVVEIEGLSALTSLTLPALTASGQIVIQGNSSLTSVALPQLASVSQVLLVGYDPLASFDVPLLVSVGQLYVVHTSLTLLDLPQLVSSTGQVNIVDNTALTSINAPKWTSLPPSSFDISNNPLLPTCEAQALATQVGATSPNIGGDSSTCP